METIWFAIVSGMLAIYVVLDGFDLGVGILHRLVARTDDERRVSLSSIGSIWDGNEVWLIAGGALLFMAFPRTYATAFSGFYLALMIVLWLMIARGVAIEFRNHQENPLWREFWDTVFSAASILLAIVFGASLGNLIRGVPLEKDGLPGLPLFTNFLPSQNPGIFDWYTTLCGFLALAALAGHGATYLVWKTTGPVRMRSIDYARKAWWTMLPSGIAVVVATAFICPEFFPNLMARPWSIVLVALSLGGYGALLPLLRRGWELPAFLASCAFLLGLLATAVVGNYPFWLRSTVDPSFSLTATNTAAADYGLRVALAWWLIGISFVIGYFVYLFRCLRGKVPAPSSEHSGSAEGSDFHNPVRDDD
jgi:cytochrome d ubiquinol oxidase subunit II